MVETLVQSTRSDSWRLVEEQINDPVEVAKRFWEQVTPGGKSAEAVSPPVLPVVAEYITRLAMTNAGPTIRSPFSS